MNAPDTHLRITVDISAAALHKARTLLPTSAADQTDIEVVKNIFFQGIVLLNLQRERRRDAAREADRQAKALAR